MRGRLFTSLIPMEVSGGRALVNPCSVVVSGVVSESELGGGATVIDDEVMEEGLVSLCYNRGEE